MRPMEIPGRPRVAFDDRSANAQRTTGWERYSRSLLSALDGRVQPSGWRRRPCGGAWRRTGSRCPAPAEGVAVHDPLHLPTFPPTPLLRGPIVWTVHDLTWWLHPEKSSAAGRAYYRPLASLALRRRDITWLTPSHQVRLEMIERFGLSPEAVGHATRSLGTSRQRAHLADRPYILSVGTLEPRKNLGLLLQAYARSAIRPPTTCA